MRVAIAKEEGADLFLTFFFPFIHSQQLAGVPLI
jgi:hypothetical protein